MIEPLTSVSRGKGVNHLIQPWSFLKTLSFIEELKYAKWNSWPHKFFVTKNVKNLKNVVHRKFYFNIPVVATRTYQLLRTLLHYREEWISVHL